MVGLACGYFSLPTCGLTNGTLLIAVEFIAHQVVHCLEE